MPLALASHEKVIPPRKAGLFLYTTAGNEQDTANKKGTLLRP